MNPREHSSGGRQRDDALVAGGRGADGGVVGSELRRAYQRLKFRRVSGVAKVAIAPRLAVRLNWMLRASGLRAVGSHVRYPE